VSIGVSIQHALASVREDREIRTDHVGFIGVVTPKAWPPGASAGDFVEATFDDPASFETHAAMGCVDSVTRLSVRSFFANGGARCTVWGLCIRGEADLTEPKLVQARLAGLLERMSETEEVSLLAMPCLGWLSSTGAARGGAAPSVEIYARLLQHCQAFGLRFLLLDPPKDATEDGVRRLVRALRERPEVDTSYGAVYFPWLMRGDVALAPSGAVAGIYARTDLANAPLGVRAAPANQDVRGFTHTAVPLGWREAGGLLEEGINPILEQPGRGLAVWGARTLSTDVRWQQVTSRRIVSLVTERVKRDAEWVVFEQLRPELWETVSRMVRARLDAFWAAGMLSGGSAGAEYLVQCDEEMNPLAVRDAGQVHVKVLLRPTAATEFIEVELQLGA
jgi:hypothetical protein